MKAVVILVFGLWALCEAGGGGGGGGGKKEGFQEDFEFVEDGKDRTGAVSGERKTWLLDSNNALCGLLRCGRREVCLLQDRFTAVCVNKAEVTRNGDKIVPLKDVADAAGGDDDDLPKSWDALDEYEDDDDNYDDDDEDDEYLLNDDDDDDDMEDDYESSPQRETTPPPPPPPPALPAVAGGGGSNQRLNRRPFAEKRCPSCPVVRPVFLCGSDNRTYSSLCRLHYHNCIHDASVRIACKGFCPCKDPTSHITKKERQRERMGAYLSKLRATKDAAAASSSSSSSSSGSSTPDPSSSSSSSASSSSAPASSNSNSDNSEDRDNTTRGRVKDNSDSNNNSATGRREKHSREGGNNNNNNNNNNKYNNRVRSRFSKVKGGKNGGGGGARGDKNSSYKYSSKYLKDAFRKTDKYNAQRRQWPWPSEESSHKTANTVWGPNECTQDALEAMGNRMLDWFSVIMADSRSRSNSVSTAPLWCKPEVSWMLGHLDSDNDGRLSVKELYQLEHDDHERCIKPFIDRCDLDRDIFLSSREWCKCFDKSERPCAALRKQSKGLLGGYIPECDSEGYYQATQCHAGAGVCWCVDRHGVELPNTRTRNTPNCDAIVSSEEVSNHVDDDAEDGDDFLDTVEGSADMPLDI
ncbi:proteoglycan Cow-like [Macrobrachium nipponense]|uniref:proteoglycan Cow-like n=1 Tax=Macrobrachium nipponense TaxID=159736 RepID=UPI0030C84F5B